MAAAHCSVVLFKLGDCLPVKKAADYEGNNTANAPGH